MISPAQVAEWLQDGLFHLLLGTLVPDVVIHATNEPLKVQAVYDFKFPCPIGNTPQWNGYHRKHPFYGKNQGQVYYESLGGRTPAVVVPHAGIKRPWQP